MLPSEIHHLNEVMQERAAEWRRTELPKRREAILNRGFVFVEELRDEIITLDELLDDPHEVWRPMPWWSYCQGWHRVEIEG